VGVGGIVVGGVLLGTAEAKVRDMEALGPSRADLATRETWIGEVSSARLYGGLGLGLGAALAGASWWIWQRPEESVVGITAQGLSWAGRF
jgi:hypothetical protein